MVAQGFFAPGIVTGTIVYLILGCIATVVVPMLFGKETPNISKRDAVKLSISLVWIATVCLWLFWVWTYMHQMIPLINPIHQKVKASA